ncbi:hypothetical protein [Bacillus coahuilensis]|nr:hypothetical protein [Bacillus coahuilensis]
MNDNSSSNKWTIVGADIFDEESNSMEVTVEDKKEKALFPVI